MKCFLDMDGVIADFVASISASHGRPSPYTDPTTRGISLGLFDIEKIWGITEREFWAPSNSEEFWTNMAKTPEADRIVELVSRAYGEDNVCILTAPSASAGCIPGKQAWINIHYPQFRNRMIFTKAKEFLAGPNRILVDDRDKNVIGFEKDGGKTILVPRLWNDRWPIADQTMDAIEIGVYDSIKSN